MPFDMFDEKFKIAAPMKATGKISYGKDEVDFLCACIIQVDGTGNITGGAYGASTQAKINSTDDPDQPTWELAMRMMPAGGGPSRRLKVGKSATGLALYRRNGGQLGVWLTPDIEIKA
jgi:hypothetical protein